jgi:hypothetical protein
MILSDGFAFFMIPKILTEEHQYALISERLLAMKKYSDRKKCRNFCMILQIFSINQENPAIPGK